MSSMLDQAIIDARELKEAAIKSAESSIIEKYSQEIREAVDVMLGSEEAINEDEGVAANIPMAASDTSDHSMATDNQVIELDFQELEQMVDQQLSSEEPDSTELEDHEEIADELEGEVKLQENDEIDLHDWDMEDKTYH